MRGPSGLLQRLVHHSDALAGNPLGDQNDREVLVYAPGGWDGHEPLPAVLALAGFSGSGFGFLNRKWRAPSLPERLDALVAAGMPPVALVMPDVLTAVGGCQYLDSEGTGRYATWLVEELRDFVGEKLPLTGVWGAMGKSSGGYGALVLSMNHPGAFQALAAHSPDAGFEYCYPPDFPGAVETIRASGGLEAWWSEFQKGGPLGSRDHAVLNLVGMSCAYSPDPRGHPLPCVLPVDLETGETRPEVFERWTRFDPARMVATHAAALKDMAGIYLDVGLRDEFRLQVGARQVSRALGESEVPHHFEEHPGGHFQLNTRFDLSLPFLAEKLS